MRFTSRVSGGRGGRLHHIGIGRARVLLLIHDLQIPIINAATCELLRELTLDPTKDNAVAHLLYISDVVRAFREMARVARPGGVILASVRDYAAARRNRLPGTLPQVNDASGDQTITFQVWDWLADGRRYNLKHFSLTPRENTWEVTTRCSTLYAFIEAELVECAQQAGLQDIEWRVPAGSGFFQPVVVASVMP